MEPNLKTQSTPASVLEVPTLGHDNPLQPCKSPVVTGELVVPSAQGEQLPVPVHEALVVGKNVFKNQIKNFLELSAVNYKFFYLVKSLYIFYFFERPCYQNLQST